MPGRISAFVICAAIAILVWQGVPVTAPRSAVDDVLKRSRSAYAALRSYADTGEMTTDDLPPGATPIVAHHTFTTYYRAPRQFLFDFKKDSKAGGELFVVWSDGGDFNTWWSATRVHETYPKGRGAVAFAMAALPTSGSALRIPPLLFAKAGLQGPVANLKEARLVGTEEVGGFSCQKLMGDVIQTYAQTGHAGAPRPTTVWIDTQSLLIRKIFEDTPKDATPGSHSRITTIIQPRTNPDLDDATFRFAVPAK